MNAVIDAKAFEDAASSEAPNESTARAKHDDMLSPRFYTTDFKAFNDIDVSLVKDEWDEMMAEFEADANAKHFRRDDGYAEQVNVAKYEPALYDELLGFFISSLTSEFSGCILYADIKKNIENEDVRKLMGCMSRDEARHAGFINKALADFGRDVDLGYLKRAKSYTFFKPKFIYYATYLSEKIGYARYIKIYRHLEAHPEHKFHPIFDWFKEWCNDEFRHGEAFALIIRADPKLTRGRNKLWIKFFQLAVYATMYVRDHTRPEMNKAFGFDPTEYDYAVFDITRECCKQCFPVLLDIDSPKFRSGLEKLRKINDANTAAKAKGGLMGKLGQWRCKLAGFTTFAGLYFMPTIKNELPEKVRMQPTW